MNRTHARPPVPVPAAAAKTPAQRAPLPVSRQPTSPDLEGPALDGLAPGERAQRAPDLTHSFADVAVEPRLPHPSGAGRPLPEPVQQQMEANLGADFSGVRIHEGEQAPSIGAVAYTQGDDIHFAPGAFRPQSSEGQQLLGHELAHVVQQRQGRVPIPPGPGLPINDDPALESEADTLGRVAARPQAAVAVSAEARSTATPAEAGAQRRKAAQKKAVQKKVAQRQSLLDEEEEDELLG